jgi:site-specific DNA recombinase
MRFAFAGRVSTEDQQDPTSSRGWQISRARSLIEPHGGVIVAEFFDVGLSRALPWKRRPQAAALLSLLADPGRGFEAVVIGEPARMFYGNQFGLTFPVFAHYGVELWVPEVGGRVDPGSDAHDLVMSLYGGMSKGERNRIKIRVRSAMAAQAATEGRFLGGRPPYGYRLVDAGPHPNPGKAADGKRLHRLEPDPVAAPVVRRIFAEYVGGRGLFAIAERLNEDGIPSPSGHDPARNRHRATGRGAWSKFAVRAILRNPRYTGRQVWGKQRKDEVLIDVDDVALGHVTKMRWNDPDSWVWSTDKVHEPLVEDELFARAQEVAAAGAHRPTTTKRRRATRTYQLSGLVRCGLCDRRMQGSWNNGRAHYRCQFAAEYAAVKGIDHPKAVYLREDVITSALDAWLAEVFDKDHLDATCETLSSASATRDDAEVARLEAARRAVDDCERRLAKYRAALDAGADPVVVAGWMAEVQGERLAAKAVLDAHEQTSDALTVDQVRELVSETADVLAMLGNADPSTKAQIYADLGIQITYDPRVSRATVAVQPCRTECVRGGT